MRDIIKTQSLYFWIMACVIDLNDERNEHRKTTTITNITNHINEAKKSHNLSSEHTFYDIKQKIYYLDGSKPTGYNFLNKSNEKTYSLNYKEIGLFFMEKYFIESNQLKVFLEICKNDKYMIMLGENFEVELKTNFVMNVQHFKNITLDEVFLKMKDKFSILGILKFLTNDF